MRRTRNEAFPHFLDDENMVSLTSFEEPLGLTGPRKKIQRRGISNNIYIRKDENHDMGAIYIF